MITALEREHETELDLVPTRLPLVMEGDYLSHFSFFHPDGAQKSGLQTFKNVEIQINEPDL